MIMVPRCPFLRQFILHVTIIVNGSIQLLSVKNASSVGPGGSVRILLEEGAIIPTILHCVATLITISVLTDLMV